MMQEQDELTKNFSPALKIINATAVPKITIQTTSKNTSGSRKGNQFLSSIMRKVASPPKNIPTLVINIGSIFSAKRCLPKIMLKAKNAPLERLHSIQLSGTKSLVVLPPVTNKKTPSIANITAKISARLGVRLL